MNSTSFRLATSLLLLLAPFAAGQDAGLRLAGHEPPLVTRLQPPDPATAERVITIEATAELRVPPTRLRVVFAANAPGETASAASAAGRELVAATQRRLEAAGIAAADIDVDFIAALPVFAWRVEAQGGKDALVEKRAGTRVQYNLHVTVPDEAAARRAMEAATAGDGVDLLAVDYWSEDLAKRQEEALAAALAAAQRKAKVLLAVFPEPPKTINVHEQTKLLFPQQLYQTLPRAEDSAANWYSRDELPRVPASRPLQVYYRGLFADVDALSPVMPCKREIEVVSTVRLYFLAPERPAVGKCGG